MVPPEQFIPLADETGLIVPLGAWVLEAACREAASWPAPYRVAVNVSPRQFSGGDFPALVADVLRRTGLPAGRLEIEITETLLINHGEAALSILQRLKQSGGRIALDDFGTGYSNLSYLQRFPFDKVKIDPPRQITLLVWEATPDLLVPLRVRHRFMQRSQHVNGPSGFAGFLDLRGHKRAR